MLLLQLLLHDGFVLFQRVFGFSPLPFYLIFLKIQDSLSFYSYVTFLLVFAPL